MLGQSTVVFLRDTELRDAHKGDRRRHSVVGVPLLAVVNRKADLYDACVKATSTRHSFANAASNKPTKRGPDLMPQQLEVRRMATDLSISVAGVKGEN